jgi:hypothetical protein
MKIRLMIFHHQIIQLLKQISNLQTSMSELYQNWQKEVQLIIQKVTQQTYLLVQLELLMNIY